MGTKIVTAISVPFLFAAALAGSMLLTGCGSKPSGDSNRPMRPHRADESPVLVRDGSIILETETVSLKGAYKEEGESTLVHPNSDWKATTIYKSDGVGGYQAVDECNGNDLCVITINIKAFLRTRVLELSTVQKNQGLKLTFQTRPFKKDWNSQQDYFWRLEDEFFAARFWKIDFIQLSGTKNSTTSSTYCSNGKCAIRLLYAK